MFDVVFASLITSQKVLQNLIPLNPFLKTISKTISKIKSIILLFTFPFELLGCPLKTQHIVVPIDTIHNILYNFRRDLVLGG